MAKSKGTRGRPVSLTTQKREFQRVLNEAKDLFAIAKPLATTTTLPQALADAGFTNARGRMIIGLAFLRVLGSWDQYLEDVFLRYMMGAKPSVGTAPTLLKAPFKTLDQAFNALCAKKKGVTATRQTDYLSWTQWATISARAAQYFQRGDLITSTLVLGSVEEVCVKDATTIRNKVAHPSKNATARFKATALRLLGGGATALRSGYMPGDLLVAPAPASFPAAHRGKDLFLAFADLLNDLSDRLVP